MNFLDAINGHIAWKLRLQNYVDGGNREYLNPDTIKHDDQCPFGQWLYREGRRYADMQLYHDVKQRHADFHLYAAEIVRMTDAGKTAQARTLMHALYTPASKQIKEMIIELGRRTANRRVRG